MTSLEYKTVKTKKPHQCNGCFRDFPAGIEMKYWATAYEGTVGSGYWCMTCDEISRNCKDDFWDGYPDGFVDEMTRDGETPEQVLERLKASKTE